jgi:hypothetical protein
MIAVAVVGMMLNGVIGCRDNRDRTEFVLFDQPEILGSFNNLEVVERRRDRIFNVRNRVLGSVFGGEVPLVFPNDVAGYQRNVFLASLALRFFRAARKSAVLNSTMFRFFMVSCSVFGLVA